MANRGQQLDFLTPSESPSGDRVISVALHTEMQQSYLEYAMSVIVGRALPDVRDGLKPVHRRIIFAMHELGLVPERPYRKSARVVGDVLGKYHPHGDQSVYDALVRLVQDFSSRYPLLAGHGNFGSVDNDPAAAMRYTECRLSPIGNEVLLSDINEAVIDFAPNFDGSQLEPTVLPAQLPMLLLNGASGIAVGMATNIPPHNLAEVVDGMIALIDRPDLDDEKLFELIPAPDFPTGGIIVENSGIRDLYTTGRGSITVRGVWALENVIGKNKRSRPAIIVTELPFQVNKAAWIEKIAELVNQGKLEGIDDLRDESDRTGMRVVMELKKDATADGVLEQLYRQTALQTNFGGSMLALCGSMPKQLTLRQLLQEFLTFREQTLTKRYRHELEECQQRLHLVDGLVTAIANLDALITLLRFAASNAEAKAELQTQFNFSIVQAEAILSMPLRRITAMEQSGLHAEMTELKTKISGFELILGDRRELLKTIKKDLRSLKKKHGNDRRTRLVNLDNGTNGGIAPTDRLSKELTPQSEQSSVSTEVPQEVLIQLTQKGYVKRLDPKAKLPKNTNDDIIIADYATSTDRDLIVLTNSGKAFPVAISDIPQGKPKGTPLIRLLPDSADAVVSNFIYEPESSLVLVTTEAKIKRLSLTELSGISSRGLMTLKLGEQDRLFWGGIVGLDGQIAIATSTGRILRMNTDEEQISTLGRSAMGTMAIRLRNSETIVGAIPVTQPDLEIVMITASGYAKRLKIKDIRLSPRTSIGSQAIMFKDKQDTLMAIAAVLPNQAHVNLGIIKDDRTKIIEIELVRIPLEPCNSSGVRIPELEVSPHQALKIYS